MSFVVCSLMQIEGKDYFLRRRLTYHSTDNGAQNGGDRIDGTQRKTQTNRSK